MRLMLDVALGLWAAVRETLPSDETEAGVFLGGSRVGIRDLLDDPDRGDLDALHRVGRVLMVGRSTRSAIERFFSKTMLGESCWLWTGRLKAGYGRLSLTARPSVAVQAHRFAFEHFIGPIPSGLTLDHLCHTADLDCPGGPSCHHRRCVNPLHLEPVPLADNVLRGRGVAARNRRKATCAHGHPFDEANTIRTVAPSGRPGRHCRACRDAHNAEWSNGKRKIEGVATIAPQAFVIFFSMLTLVTWLYMSTVRGAA